MYEFLLNACIEAQKSFKALCLLERTSFYPDWWSFGVRWAIVECNELGRFFTPTGSLCKIRSEISRQSLTIYLVYLGWNPHFLDLTEFKTRLRALVDIFSLQPHSPRRNVASLALLKRYFHWKCSNAIHSLVPAVQAFRVKTHHDTSTWSNHSYSIRIPLVKKEFNSSGLSPTFCGTDSRDDASLISLKSYLLKLRINHYLHAKISFSIRLLWAVLGPCIGLLKNNNLDSNVKVFCSLFRSTLTLGDIPELVTWSPFNHVSEWWDI